MIEFLSWKREEDKTSLPVRLPVFFTPTPIVMMPSLASCEELVRLLPQCSETLRLVSGSRFYIRAVPDGGHRAKAPS
jgi:hypothetical protein